MNNNRKVQNGFTLIELMIVVAIVAIVGGIALPSYNEQVTKSKRSDAKVALLKYAQIQENYFVQNLSYAKSFKNETGGLRITDTDEKTISENNLYDIGLTVEPDGCDGLAGNNACTGYTLDAVATNAQLGDKHCGTFELNNLGRKLAKKPGETSYTSDSDPACW